MKQNLILSNERVDDLQLNGLKIIQNPEWFCFGTDAVLLSDFAAKGIKKDAVILDMCFRQNPTQKKSILSRFKRACPKWRNVRF